METANTAPRRSEDSGELTVGQVAGLVGVSVRTLHHWDEIGLVVPSARSWAGYRLYGPDDVARIHRVLVYRETGMPLAEVARVLDDPDVDATAHLARQRDLLQARIAHLTRMLRAVDTMMERNSMGENLTPQQQAEILGAEWDPAWQEEAEERWGDSDEWAQAAARKAAMTRQDWARVAEETEALETDLANAMREGVVPGSERANAPASTGGSTRPTPSRSSSPAVMLPIRASLPTTTSASRVWPPGSRRSSTPMPPPTGWTRPTPSGSDPVLILG